MAGNPIECPRIAEPTRAQVDAYHAQYVTEVCALFERNKLKYAAEDATLEVF